MKLTIAGNLENIERLATDVGDRVNALTEKEADHLLTARIALNVYQARRRLAKAFEAAEILVHVADAGTPEPTPPAPAPRRKAKA